MNLRHTCISNSKKKPLVCLVGLPDIFPLCRLHGIWYHGRKYHHGPEQAAVAHHRWLYTAGHMAYWRCWCNQLYRKLHIYKLYLLYWVKKNLNQLHNCHFRLVADNYTQSYFLMIIYRYRSCWEQFHSIIFLTVNTPEEACFMDVRPMFGTGRVVNIICVLLNRVVTLVSLVNKVS